MAGMDLSLIVAKHVEEMRKAGGSPSDEALNQLAAQIAAGFGTKKDQVAILRLSEDGRMLRFVYPTKLVKIGTIPLTTAHSLATKTIKDRRGEIVNNFSVYKHPTVFEAVDLSTDEKATPIQKIMSAPMIAGGKVVGVMQVSHKGRPGETVGPDFTPQDLSELTEVGSILGQYLSTLPFAPPLSQKSHPEPPARA
jgi:GAF domain-containing protein